MVYTHDDPDRMCEEDFNIPDTPLERFVHGLTLCASILFIMAAGLYLLTTDQSGFKLMLALGTGGVLTLSLVAFFSVIMADH